jgi:hypothetical protein
LKQVVFVGYKKLSFTVVTVNGTGNVIFHDKCFYALQ